jgi:hypothetical protein
VLLVHRTPEVSSDIVNEVFQSLVLDQLQDAVVLSTLVIVVVLLELRPLTLGVLLIYIKVCFVSICDVHTLFHGEVVDLFGELATLDKLLHLRGVFPLHALCVGRVLRL